MYNITKWIRSKSIYCRTSLAALYVSEIDNAVIEVNSEEVPIMDGSSKDFLNSIEKAGIKKLSKKENI